MKSGKGFKKRNTAFCPARCMNDTMLLGGKARSLAHRSAFHTVPVTRRRCTGISFRDIHRSRIRSFAPEAGLLDAAERRDFIRDDAGIDAHHAVVELFRD